MAERRSVILKCVFVRSEVLGWVWTVEDEGRDEANARDGARAWNEGTRGRGMRNLSIVMVEADQEQEDARRSRWFALWVLPSLRALFTAI